MKDSPTSKNDVNILVEFAPDVKVSLFRLASIEHDLSEVLDRPTHMMTFKSVETSPNPLFREAVFDSAEFSMSKSDDQVGLVAMGVYASKAIFMLGKTEKEELDLNEMMQFALMKLEEIVGEAANRVSKQSQAKHPEIPWSEVIGMRNRLVHDFEAVDLSTLRETIIDDLPPILRKLRTIVGEGVADAAFPRTDP